MPRTKEATTNISAVDWLPRIDFLLDHPVTKVWPYLLRWDTWISNYTCEHLSGEPDKSGEIKRITSFNDNGEAQGSFHVEVVRVEPEQRLVYRLIPFDEPVFGVEEISGYEIYNVYDLDGKTLVTYETVARMATTLSSQDELSARWGPAHEQTVRTWLDTYVPDLRRLLEADK